MGEKATESCKSYSSLGVTVNASVTLIPSNHFPLFTMIHSVTCFYVHIVHILVHNLFPRFLSLSLCLAPSTAKVIIFFTSHHHPFLNMIIPLQSAYFYHFTMFSFPNHCLNQRCKQDQILKIKTIITRPSPRPLLTRPRSRPRPKLQDQD